MRAFFFFLLLSAEMASRNPLYKKRERRNLSSLYGFLSALDETRLAFSLSLIFRSLASYIRFIKRKWRKKKKKRWKSGITQRRYHTHTHTRSVGRIHAPTHTAHTRVLYIKAAAMQPTWIDTHTELEQGGGGEGRR